MGKLGKFGWRKILGGLIVDAMMMMRRDCFFLLFLFVVHEWRNLKSLGYCNDDGLVRDFTKWIKINNCEKHN